MNRATQAFLIKVCFAALLYQGWIVGVAGARNIVAFVLTLNFIVSILLLVGDAAKNEAAKGTALPLPVHIAYSASVIIFLAWHGAFWLAAAQTINFVIFFGIHANKPSKGIQA